MGRDDVGGFHNEYACFRDLAAHSARVLLLTSRPLQSEGAGNAGCTLHPRSRVQYVHKNTHTSIQVQSETLRHSPRNGFTAYIALSPATNSSCHRRCRLDGGIESGRIDLATGSLAPATG